ncbi:hypothetical protein GCM10009591_07310 [Brachybacterium tyrofermentans]
MRGEHHVLQREQGAAGRERLDLEDVEPGPGDRAVLQGGDQGRLIDHGAAGDVDEECGVLHPGQLRGTDQVTGLGVRGDRDDQVVAAGDHLIELELGRADLGAELGTGRPVPGDDLEVQGAQLAHRLLPDAAQTDHADGRGGQARASVLRLAVPVGLADQAVLGQQVVGEGEQEGQRGVGHRHPQPGGSVGDGDPGGIAGLEVHGVEAGTETGHVRERGDALELRGAEGRAAEQQHSIEALERPGADRDLDPGPFDPLLGERAQADVAVDGGAVRFGVVRSDGELPGAAHALGPSAVVPDSGSRCRPVPCQASG